MTLVSISLSSGFSFQVHFATLFGSQLTCFNLVIELLLISGRGPPARKARRCKPVSISLSSGFSFQVTEATRQDVLEACFNLVIERLLISGLRRDIIQRNRQVEFQSRYRAASHFRFSTGGRDTIDAIVSISLSSGFSFQDVWVSASNWSELIRFNLVIERLLISGNTASGPSVKDVVQFQSRYRAASHFRLSSTSSQ